MSATESKRGSRAAVLGVVAVVMLIGAIVGVVSLHLGRRAPRAGGHRVAVIGVAGAPWADDAIARALEGTPGVSVVTAAEVRSRIRVLRMKNKQATALDAAGALALYAIVDGASPNHIEARDADGTVLAQAEAADLEHAAASLSRALAKGAGEAPERALPTSSMAAYAHYAVAENALESDRTGDAERELDAALKIDPAFSSAWLAKAMLIVDRGSGDSDMDLADEALSHVVDSALSDKERLFAAGYRDWVAARTDANVDKRPPHVEDAIDVLRKATVEFPEDMRSHYALGRVYNRLVGAHEEAVRHLENARRLAPDRLSVAKEYADAWLGAGQRSDAESIIKAYIRLVPEDERGRNALRDLGVIQAGTGSQTAVVR